MSVLRSRFRRKSLTDVRCGRNAKSILSVQHVPHVTDRFFAGMSTECRDSRFVKEPTSCRMTVAIQCPVATSMKRLTETTTTGTQESTITAQELEREQQIVSSIGEGHYLFARDNRRHSDRSYLIVRFETTTTHEKIFTSKPQKTAIFPPPPRSLLEEPRPALQTAVNRGSFDRNLAGPQHTAVPMTAKSQDRSQPRFL